VIVKPWVLNPLQAPDGCGCLLEATRNGAKPLQLANGGSWVYLQDGDTVTLTGVCQGDGYCVGFGECTGRLLPARG
jgi:fumarylacetoacetase